MNGEILRVCQMALVPALALSLILTSIVFALSVVMGAPRYQVWEHVFSRIPLLGFATFFSFAVWGLAASVSGYIFFGFLFPMTEPLAGLLYGNWLSKRKSGEISGHFLYWPLITVTSLVAGFYVGQASAALMRTQSQVALEVILSAMLFVAAFLGGKLCHLYFAEWLLPILAKWRSDKDATEIDLADRLSLAKERSLADAARERERLAKENLLAKRIEHLRKNGVEGAQIFAKLFCSRHNLNPNRGFGHVFNDAQELTKLLDESTLNDIRQVVSGVKKLWDLHARGDGYYLADRQLIRDAVTANRLFLSADESRAVDQRIDRLCQELFADKHLPQPKSAQEANETIVREYRHRYPGNLATAHSYLPDEPGNL